MKVPKLCKGCPNAVFFKDGTCWYYWAKKTECTTRIWKEKGLDALDT